MKKLILVIFVFSLIFASQAKADVYYECNKDRDFILIAETEWGAKLASLTEEKKKKVISTRDIIKTTTKGETAFRTGTIPILNRCRLSSGEYLVRFDAYWINGNILGLDGGDDWITVEIYKNKEIILPLTVLGFCSNERPPTKGCKNKWAVKVWLSGRYEKPTVTRILNEDIP